MPRRKPLEVGDRVTITRLSEKDTYFDRLKVFLNKPGILVEYRDWQDGWNEGRIIFDTPIGFEAEDTNGELFPLHLFEARFRRTRKLKN